MMAKSAEVTLALSSSKEEENLASEEEMKSSSSSSSSVAADAKRKRKLVVEEEGEEEPVATARKGKRKGATEAATKKKPTTKKTAKAATKRKGKAKAADDNDYEDDDDKEDEEEQSDGDSDQSFASESAAKKRKVQAGTTQSCTKKTSKAKGKKGKNEDEPDDENFGLGGEEEVEEVAETVVNEVKKASGRWHAIQTWRIPILLKWLERNYDDLTEEESVSIKTECALSWHCSHCKLHNVDRDGTQCKACNMQAPWPLSEKWWRSKREMKDKAKQQKAKKLYKKFMKEKAPAEDSFSHPFYLRCLPWSPNVYRGNNMFELHDSEDRLIGRLEAINSSHTTLLSELREVIKMLYLPSSKDNPIISTRPSEERKGKKKVWGDEQNSFGSTDALWKIECDFVPKNEEDDKDFSFTTSYSAFSWSKLLTQDEIKKQQKANFIRIISISVCFDAGRFEALVKRGLPVPGRSVLFQLLRRNGHKQSIFAAEGRANDLTVFDQVCAATSSQTHRKQPSRVKTSLYGYQLNAMAWMSNLENNVKADKGYPLSKVTTVDWTTVLFDMRRNRFFLPDEVKETCLMSKGGIYADEMGLGKTITMLALILANPLDLTRPPAVDKYHFVTKATLVLAPNHLCKQWTDEAKKNIKPSLDVVVLTTITQCQKITYRQIMKADLVVVSFQLLKNKHYLQQGCVENHGPLDIIGRRMEIKTRAQELKRRVNPYVQTGPILEHFFWHRVIVDEGHEVLSDDSNDKKANFYIRAIDQIQSSYRWYVSGTPFPHAHTSLYGAMRFLKSRIPRCCLNDHVLEKRLLETIRANLYWRNTKESIGKEYNIPDIVEELVFLEPSEVELGLYEDARLFHDEVRMRQLCCHMQISEIDRRVLGIEKKTLDEIRKEMIAHKQDEEKQAIQELKELETEELDIRNALKLSKFITDRDKSTLNSKLAVALHKIANKKKEISNYRATLAYFESLIPQVAASTEEPCVICFETVTDLTITPCGHMYCRQCIESALEVAQRCPTCRNPLSRAQLTQVLEQEQKQAIEEKHEISALVQKYGTKMAHLIKMLGELLQNKENRIIIFSQWHHMLHKVGDTLKENGINNVYVQGNVWQRNKAVTTFKECEDDPKSSRVIMLSLEKAASGTNLTEATHIIMIDPVDGTPEEVAAIESQAIGRAHRQGQKKQLTVIRLIMKNTIEHEIYERHAKAMAEAAAKAKQDPKYTSTTSSISSSSSSSISVPTEDNGNAEEESKPKKVKKAEKPNESSSGDEDGSGSDGDGDGDDDDDEEKMDVETNNTAAKAKESKSDWRNDPSIDFGNLAKHTVAQLRTYVYKHNLPIRARKKERLIKAILHHRNMKS